MNSSLRNALYALLTAALVSPGLVGQDADPVDPAPAPTCADGCKDNLIKPANANEPASASDSWRFSLVRGWNRLTSKPGTCAPVTPGPGCVITKKCKLTTTRGTFKIVLKSKLPTTSGTTGPTPGAGWGAPDPGQSPPQWTFTVSKANPKEVNCGGVLDLSISWLLAGTPMSWTLKLECSVCPGAPDNDTTLQQQDTSDVSEH